MLPFAPAAALVSAVVPDAVVLVAAVAAGALKPMVASMSANMQHNAMMVRCFAVLLFISALSLWLVISFPSSEVP